MKGTLDLSDYSCVQQVNKSSTAVIRNQSGWFVTAWVRSQTQETAWELGQRAGWRLLLSQHLCWSGKYVEADIYGKSPSLDPWEKTGVVSWVIYYSTLNKTFRVSFPGFPPARSLWGAGKDTSYCSPLPLNWDSHYHSSRHHLQPLITCWCQVKMSSGNVKVFIFRLPHCRGKSWWIQLTKIAMGDQGTEREMQKSSHLHPLKK